MKLVSNAKVVVYKAVTDSFKDKSGKDISFFKLNIEQGNGVASISCTEDVAKEVTPMKEYTLVAEYDTENKKLRFIDIAGNKPVKPQ